MENAFLPVATSKLTLSKLTWWTYTIARHEWLSIAIAPLVAAIFGKPSTLMAYVKTLIP